MDLSHLNLKQKQAVVETEGPMMILAGAGSGKTRTLVSRITYLLEEKNVSPYQVLALTFSNKAAGEMRDRVSRDVSADIGALQITTFHSFCARVLRSEANHIGLSKNFTIYDTSEAKTVVKGILNRRGISQKDVSPFEVLYFIDDLKNTGHYPGRNIEDKDYEVDKSDMFFDMYLEYEREIHKSNATDFGGLITGVIQLFEKYPEVLKRYQERFRYILVDEYQDTNRAQFDLVCMLSAQKRNICVVGDEDQSIYSWRGADIRNILDFEEVFPDAKLLKLEQNYRSSKNIIDAASAVIARNTQRKGKKMWTDNSEGNSIEIVECHNDKEEAEFVVNKTKETVAEGSPYDEIAVFYRTNSQSRLIEDALRASNIPYRVVGGIKFYERKEIKDLLAYIRIVVNDKDSLAISRVINVPTRGIGATTIRKIEEEAIKNAQSLWEVVVNIVDNPEEYKHIRLTTRVKNSLSHFVQVINDAKLADQTASPSDVFEKLLYESGYWEMLRAKKDYESQARMENLQELGNAISQFEMSDANANLQSFLETITLDQNNNSEDEEESKLGEVSLMTIHGAKGLEFNHVFVTGAEENIFPSYQSMENGEESIEEERRLFYVAMTRAMKMLYISFAQARMLFGQLRFNGPSRFIHEIPNKFYNWEKIGGGKQQFFNDENDDWDDFSDPEYDEPVYQVQTSQVKKSRFPKGSKVVHSLYGEGKVLASEGPHGEEKVTIQFRDGAKKKFMAKFAGLTVL